MVVLIVLSLTSILSVPAALISEKDLKAFRLGFNMELIAIGCSVRNDNYLVSYLNSTYIILLVVTSGIDLIF